MKKLMLLLMSLIMAFSVCTGCGKGGDTVLGENEHATIRFLAGGTQWQGTYLANLQSFIDDFNDGKLGEAAKALNMTIELDKAADMDSTFPMRLRSETRYPHVLLFDRFNTPTNVQNDFLLDVTDRFENAGIDLGKFTQSAVSEMKVADKVYGAPIDLDLWGIYVNLGHVEAYNESHADAPITLHNDWTWTEFLDIAEKLTVRDGNSVSRAGYAAGDLQEHYFKYFLTTGEEFLTDGNRPNMDAPAAKATLEFMKKIQDANVSKSVEDIGFPRGQVSMMTRSVYYADYIEKINNGQTDKVRYRFMPFPKAESAGYTLDKATESGMLGGFGLVVPKPIAKLQTDAYYSYADRSVKLIKWWTQGEGAALWAKYTNTMPALSQLQQNEELMEFSVLRDAAQFVNKYKIRPQVGGFMNYQIYTINNNVRSYLDGKSSVNETLSALKDNTYLED